MTTEYSDQFVIGIDVGGTGLKGSVIDCQGHVFTREHRATQRERGSEAVIESILSFADDLVKKMLFEPLIAQLAREVTLQPVPPVLPAALGNDAGYLGAALKAWLALGVPHSDLNWHGVG